MRHRLALALLLLATGCGGASAPEPTGHVENPPPVTEDTGSASTESSSEPAPAPGDDDARDAASDGPPLTTAPPPAPPGAPGAPPGNLVPWDPGQPLEGPRGVVAGEGPLVFFDESRFVAVFGDGETETRIRPNPVGYTSVFADRTVAQAPVASGVLLIRGEGNVLAGVDRDALEVRWTREIEAVSRSRETHLSSGDALIVVADRRLLSLDPETGETLWETEVRRSTASQRWRAAGGLLFLHDGELRARDARTGEVRWETAGIPHDARLFDVADGRLPVLVDHDELVLLDVADGSERARLELASGVPFGRNLVIDGGVAYATEVRHDRGATLRVAAWDLARGRRLWRSPPMAMDGTGFHPSLGLDDDVLVVCTNHWTAQALDRRHGRPVWVGHPSSCALPTTWRPRDGAPNVLLTSPSPDAAFARAAEAPERRRVTVSGRVTCEGRPAANARVWVGGQRVRTDGNGRYRATLHAGRTIPLFVHQHDVGRFSFCSSERRTVRITGRRITADFDLELGGQPSRGAPGSPEDDPLGSL